MNLLQLARSIKKCRPSFEKFNTEMLWGLGTKIQVCWKCVWGEGGGQLQFFPLSIFKQIFYFYDEMPSKGHEQIAGAFMGWGWENLGKKPNLNVGFPRDPLAQTGLGRMCRFQFQPAV
jgi:hypothetical protein